MSLDNRKVPSYYTFFMMVICNFNIGLCFYAVIAQKCE